MIFINRWQEECECQVYSRWFCFERKQGGQVILHNFHTKWFELFEINDAALSPQPFFDEANETGFLSPSPWVTCPSDATAKLQLSESLTPSNSNVATQDCSPMKGLPIFLLLQDYKCGIMNQKTDKSVKKMFWLLRTRNGWAGHIKDSRQITKVDEWKPRKCRSKDRQRSRWRDKVRAFGRADWSTVWGEH